MTKNSQTIDKLIVYGMSAILVIAGIAHFIFPNIFLPAMPPYIPMHLPIIYLTGGIEIILAIGILNEKYRKTSALILMGYLIAILPAHIHVSINGIEMFGITNKFLLWTRTVLQSVFIYWAYRIKKLSSI